MESFFFYFTKIAWGILAPDALLLILLALGFLLLFTRHQKLAKYLIGLPLASALVTACLPIDEWLLLPLESAFPANPNLPAHVDGIIVLGGAINTLPASEWKQPELNGAAERMTATLALARQYPDATVLFTGGSGYLQYQTLREADYARQFFTEQGLPENRVFFENTSRNTFENAVYSKELIKPESGETWILITSATHMPRSIGVFCQQEWSLIPYPVDHNTSPSRKWRVEFQFLDNLAALKKALYEYGGLMVYSISGKTSQLFPKGCF